MGHEDPELAALVRDFIGRLYLKAVGSRGVFCGIKRTKALWHTLRPYSGSIVAPCHSGLKESCSHSFDHFDQAKEG
jgi:hypothetical protein